MATRSTSNAAVLLVADIKALRLAAEGMFDQPPDSFRASQVFFCREIQ